MRDRVNDFALKLANVNGTGSASANGLLMQAIFRMGIPVSGKNLFPSNIQGLPTWYEIRVNKDGYTARALDYDLMVAMNSQTYARDVAEVREGGYLLYDSTWPLDPALHPRRRDIIWACRSRKCATTTFSDPRERILMKNIAYAGTLVAALDVDMDDRRAASGREVRRQEERCANRTPSALRLGYDYAHEHFECPLPFHLEKMDANDDKILIDGNTATALGCVYAGATVAAWYPITPSTSVHGRLQSLLREVPQGSGNRQEQLHHHAGRGRAGRHRHGDRRVLERRARVHFHRRPRHFADERTAGPGLLRRDSGRHHRRAARRPVHRHADAHAAGRSAGMRLRLARRHETYSAVSVESRPSASNSRRTRSIWPSVSRRRFS